jgi:hypothetical protein
MRVRLAAKAALLGALALFAGCTVLTLPPGVAVVRRSRSSSSDYSARGESG